MLALFNATELIQVSIFIDVCSSGVFSEWTESYVTLQKTSARDVEHGYQMSAVALPAY